MMVLAYSEVLLIISKSYPQYHINGSVFIDNSLARGVSTDFTSPFELLG